jgi:hypothetical protein
LTYQDDKGAFKCEFLILSITEPCPFLATVAMESGISLLFGRIYPLLKAPLKEKPSSGLDPQEHHPETLSHPVMQGYDIENNGGD